MDGNKNVDENLPMAVPMDEIFSRYKETVIHCPMKAMVIVHTNFHCCPY